MQQTVGSPDHETKPDLAVRPIWQSARRGLRGRCPACGVGRLFVGYLAVNESCPCCGEELHHHRADDFPSYITIFVVGHLLGGALLLVDELWPDVPLSIHFALWPILAIVLSLWLLPIIKGMLIAYQWALRMHGFETAHVTLVPKAAPPVGAKPATRTGRSEAPFGLPAIGTTRQNPGRMP